MFLDPSRHRFDEDIQILHSIVVQHSVLKHYDGPKALRGLLERRLIHHISSNWRIDELTLI